MLNRTIKAVQFTTVQVQLTHFGFSCLPLGCCADLKYNTLVVHTSQEKGPRVAPFYTASNPTRIFQDGPEVIDVFTGEVGVIEFTVTVADKQGGWFTSPSLFVEIAYDCNYDEVTRVQREPN